MAGLIGQQNHAAYVSTKGAMISLTKALAADYAQYSIRVNAICPAGVWTAMLEQWCGEQPGPGSIRSYLDEIHLLGYCPSGDVVADVAVFLLSSWARFITGCSEFLTVSLLAKRFNVPVPAHVGNMGQLHQHLVLFNHIALGHEVLFLEHIPHLREYFVFPAKVSSGIYETPSEPGASCDLKL